MHVSTKLTLTNTKHTTPHSYRWRGCADDAYLEKYINIINLNDFLFKIR